MILRFSFSARPLALCAGLALLVLPLQGARSAADAFKLYSQKQYAASADAFEEVVKSSTPDARLYYYAGLANRDAGRPARARQIFQHLINSFSGSPEAPFAQQALNGMNPNGPVVTTAAASAPAATASSNQPPSKDASTVLESAHHRSRPTTERKKMAFVFTPQDIARDGAEGVDQTNAPNCWFESSMAALASLPKGQVMISQMIRYGDGDSYIIRFPGDGVEYVMTEADARSEGVNSKALWATLLDCAQRRKFPDNRGAEGVDGDQSRLEVGLGSITGRRAEVIRPGHCDLNEISSFINGAVRSGNPIVAGTAGRVTSNRQPIIDQHAYTIIGWDSAKNMVIIRNPHGKNSQHFELPSDPQHLDFEQLEGGTFKMSVRKFHDCFGSAARSFI